MEPHVVAIGLPPIDVGGPNDPEHSIDLDGDAIQVFPPAAGPVLTQVIAEQRPEAVILVGSDAGLDALLRACKGFAKARRVVRLQ